MAGIRLRQFDFRYHAITRLVENPDVSEESAEALAGHISHRMKKCYSHIRIAQKRAAVATLSRIQSAKAPPVPITEQPSLTNGAVLDMLKDLPPEIVVAKIKSSRCRFNTLPETLKQLKAEGVPDSVILAMVKAS